MQKEVVNNPPIKDYPKNKENEGSNIFENLPSEMIEKIINFLPLKELIKLKMVGSLFHPFIDKKTSNKKNQNIIERSKKIHNINLIKGIIENYENGSRIPNYFKLKEIHKNQGNEVKKHLSEIQKIIDKCGSREISMYQANIEYGKILKSCEENKENEENKKTCNLQ